MKKRLIQLLLIIILASTNFILYAQSKMSKTFSTNGKKVQVYSTAENTNLVLSKDAGLVDFKKMGQPFETQLCVFVDPDKTFQTFFGIGAALTDASAETWAK